MTEPNVETGLKVFAELMGPEAGEAMTGALQSDGFGSDLARIACQFAFAAVWNRDGLERKQRSLVTIGILIALRQTAELKNHIRIGLNNGLTVREIEETLIQAVPYAGFPAVASAMEGVVEVLRERGLEADTKTARERGML